MKAPKGLKGNIAKVLQGNPSRRHARRENIELRALFARRAQDYLDAHDRARLAWNRVAPDEPENPKDLDDRPHVYSHLSAGSRLESLGDLFRAIANHLCRWPHPPPPSYGGAKLFGWHMGQAGPGPHAAPRPRARFLRRDGWAW